MQPEPLVRLPDGTAVQVSPLTGTVVWSVPRRGHRPIATPQVGRRAVEPDGPVDRCEFCPDRYLETTPEKSRLVRDAAGWSLRSGLTAAEVVASAAEFRRFANLFEILTVDHWRRNHGFVLPPTVVARAARYAADPLGRAHTLAVLRRRAAAEGVGDGAWDALTEAEQLAGAPDLFAGTHDVVVARRHLVDGAQHDDELAGSGTLTTLEHVGFVAFTIEALRSLYAEQPHACYVAAFQNWLRPAGASFDHLHKQLVAVDEHGPLLDGLLGRLREDPDLVTTAVLDHAAEHRLVVAENDHAVAVVGIGHRRPSLVVWATGPPRLPWEHGEHEVQAVSDLLHALHAVTGVHVPTNEVWFHRPPGAAEALPWHVVLTRRDTNLAGFEAGTEIHVTAVDPAVMRDDVVGGLLRLREAGAIAPMRVGDECSHRLGTLRAR
ncbi:DUF4921 family protein [Actinotalea sp. K2]|uniref:DUF4921 family protein n=1 Tax=Actinotalea sp. K2 TaxID=2939438 RepID=UPI00201801FE|nr:DUF4921 family protein [Actinotalea sp. K2]MCL3859786.1 DUF4921 family protein [Actinotalea sp. K2]